MFFFRFLFIICLNRKIEQEDTSLFVYISFAICLEERRKKIKGIVFSKSKLLEGFENDKADEVFENSRAKDYFRLF